MKSFQKNGKKIAVSLKAGRSINDPEKAVLPTILVINTNHPAHGIPGFCIMLIWWDWEIRLTVVSRDEDVYEDVY